jgi:hypothetical protein
LNFFLWFSKCLKGLAAVEAEIPVELAESDLIRMNCQCLAVQPVMACKLGKFMIQDRRKTVRL